MTTPGWYPDPAGNSNLFRYWDGTQWSAATATNVGAPAPTAVRSSASASGSARRTAITVGAIGLALALIIGGVIWLVSRANNLEISTPEGGQATSERECPSQQSPPTGAPESLERNGRVYGGKMSYPTLGAPWAAPSPETRLAFSTNATTQTVFDQEYGPGRSWVASVLIGNLVAGDGFFAPEEGARRVMTCISGTFYGDNTRVERKDSRNEALKVDGKDGWFLESRLSFKIPQLNATSELVLLVVVNTGDGTSSLYYASIPNTKAELEAPARELIKQLKVES